MMNGKENSSLLSVKNLSVEFHTEKGRVCAVNGVSFDIEPGETVGIVGESGCGKTVTALSLLKLVPSPPGIYAAGTVEFQGIDLLSLPKREVRKIRGKEISMIFQEPMTALNPVFRVGNQMVDVLRHHRGLSGREAREAAIDLLKMIHVPAPEKRIDEYPHQLSGGMRQRVMIAMALSCHPKLMIADEPTTAVDVTTQAQVLDEMNKLQKKFNMALILVTHDLGLVAETCERVIVMYCGKIMEKASVGDLFDKPRHPYTRGLLESIAKIRDRKLAVLPTIEGMVPDLFHVPKGCVFSDRCPMAEEICHRDCPELVGEGGRSVACFFPYE